jgi:hypothetical protein
MNIDLAYRMGRLEAELQDLSGFKYDVIYSRNKIREVIDSLLNVFDSLKTMHDGMNNLLYRVSELEKALYSNK